MNQKRLKAIFIINDLLAAILAWGLFYAYRKSAIERVSFEISDHFFIGLIFVPLFWLCLYFILGTYNNLRRMYFMRILSLSLSSFLIGTLFIFFFLILDDQISKETDYYKLLIVFFFLHALLTFIPRLITTYFIVRQIAQRKAGFRTIIVGSPNKATEIFKEIEGLHKGTGFLFMGYLGLNEIDMQSVNELNALGTINNIEEIIEKYKIEEVIIALDSSEHDTLRRIITRIQGRDISIKITANMYDLLSGSVKTSNIFGAMLIEVNDDLMPHWKFMVKRFTDLAVSITAMLLLTPVYIVLAILVKTSSKGPIFFLQERIGKNGVPFNIIKFRTMNTDAEKSGPQLSSENDDRITGVGKFMRKVRLDETPQFWNVIKSDMSLVGPRPERQFFIDKIKERDPQFLQLNKVKPGITSWGQVKYGYAENVDQMLQRMKYDLLYIKNMSLSIDLKIILYTIIIVFKGSGK